VRRQRIKGNSFFVIRAEETMQAVQVKPAAIDPRMLAPFVNAVREVLKSTAGWESTVGRLRLKQTPGPEYDYSGIIAFSGTIVGTVVVSFTKDVAVKLIAAFVGCEIPPDTGDFADAVGELTNLIVGAAKTGFGVNATISVPSVVMGNGHIIARPGDIPCVVVPCKTAAGEFAVEVSIKTV
jgi:chemotaxis protein CheX